MRAPRAPIAACALASIVAAIVAGNSPAATTALTVDAIGPGRSVVGSDGRLHVDYDLLITNSFVGDVTLQSLRVRSEGRVLQRLDGEELAAHTHPILRESVPVQTLAPSQTVMVLLDVTLPRGVTPPKQFRHVITYTLPDDSPANAVIDSLTVRGASVRVQSRRPMVIAPPLRGPGWWVGGGCCDPNQRHRGLLLANAEGRLIPTEMFDIDWLQLTGDDRLFNGDGTHLTDYPGYGADVHSVSGGRVIAAVDDLPDSSLTEPNTDFKSADEFGGNRVVVRIAPNRFAFYAHFVPGSVRVDEGQRVRPGEVLGLLGNSGNSAAPHLHFGIHNGPSPSTSASLPWVFPGYEYQGSGDVTPSGEVPLSGVPASERRTYPLNLASVVLK